MGRGDDLGAASAPLVRLADGTVKQVSPVTGTVVWTVPGRSHRPIPVPPTPVEVLAPEDRRRACAFCPDRYRETPPERARLVREAGAEGRPVDVTGSSDAAGAGPAGPGSRGHLTGLPDGWRVLRDLPAEQLAASTAEFRRIPNLYPILPFRYWQLDHGMQVPPGAAARAHSYVSTAAGREHVAGLLRAQGRDGVEPDLAGLADEELAERALALFASTHDLVVARRHVVDGAVTSDRLCSSGELDREEHAAFLALTIDALRDLTESNPHARYVSVFQNWLRPAGASFDHLHKQLVAIDEWGPLMQRAVDLLAAQPDLFNTAVADFAAAQGLVIAEHDGALALAGVGHRYPTIEVFATRGSGQPWQHERGSVRAVSDLLHACHAASGAHVPSNEEWHYRPVGAPAPMPWRINLKWRVSTLAGFEGGTKINVNTIDPYALRDIVVARLLELRGSGRIDVARIGDECTHRSGALDYAGG